MGWGGSGSGRSSRRVVGYQSVERGWTKKSGGRRGKRDIPAQEEGGGRRGTRDIPAREEWKKRDKDIPAREKSPAAAAGWVPGPAGGLWHYYLRILQTSNEIRARAASKTAPQKYSVHTDMP